MLDKPQNKFTAVQNQIVWTDDKSLLVSASAGTGKTTVMLERVCRLIKDKDIDLKEILVVTFTTLAAADMKARLVEKLSDMSSDARIATQLEEIDLCNISTLHSFCNDIMRNYFYVVDIDPSFSILDSLTTASLRNTCMSEVLAEYYQKPDQHFEDIYKIFQKHRDEKTLKKQLLSLYDFSRHMTDFQQFWQNTRNNFLNVEDSQNAFASVILTEISQSFCFFENSWRKIAELMQKHDQEDFCEISLTNAEMYSNCDLSTLENALNAVTATRPLSLTSRNAKRDTARNLDIATVENLRGQFKALQDTCDGFRKRFGDFIGKPFDILAHQTKQILPLCDKLVEILCKFEQRFFEAKKQRGALDFNDLEHLCLLILSDTNVCAELKNKYKYIFVDEYQDINDVQEQIISKLGNVSNLFFVGDVKQSIYGFRGCDCNIFVQKQRAFQAENTTNQTFEMNQNFRSSKDILNFANIVFGEIMTESFGSIDYKKTSMLLGENVCQNDFPSVFVDVAEIPDAHQKAVKDVCDDTDQTATLPENAMRGIYDITAELEDTDTKAVMEGKIVACRIKQFLGKTITLANGKSKTIEFGDIAILSRSMKEKALDIYNVLVQNNIPVAANFSLQGLKNKEIRDITNFLRVIDNAFCDIPLAGVCLSHFGGLTEEEISKVCVATSGENLSLFQSIEKYIGQQKDEISEKLSTMCQLIEELRFFGFGATVDQVVLQLIKKTSYHLFVQGLPNGHIRIRKLFDFVDKLKGKSYAQSIDKFICYIDETEDSLVEQANTQSNAVKMMSMHASKGLEFPIVFLVNTDGKFQYDSGVLRFNKHLGVAMDFYNFSTMRVSDSLACFAIKQKNRFMQNEEEMRLLYVAMTRAKNILCIVNSQKNLLNQNFKKPPQNCTSHSQWILPTLKKHFGDAFCDGFFGEGVALKIWNSSKHFDVLDAPTASLLCQQDNDLEGALQKLSYVYHHKHSANLPSKIVSSAIDKAFLDIDDLPQTLTIVDDVQKQQLGSAYHKILEHSNLKATAVDISKTLDLLIQNGTISLETAKDIDLNLVFLALNNADLIALADGAKIYHELPFMLNTSYNSIFGQTDGLTAKTVASTPVEKPTSTDTANAPQKAETVEKNLDDEKIILQGVIDLLIQKPEKAIVIDFKFVKNSKYVQKNYQHQLNSYRRAVQEIVGIQNVDCYVFSISDNKLIPMP